VVNLSWHYSMDFLPFANPQGCGKENASCCAAPARIGLKPVYSGRADRR